MTCEEPPCTWPAPCAEFGAALGAPDNSVTTALQFLVLAPSAPGGGTLPGLLRHFRRFDAFGGLVAHWRLFGTSGHVQRPRGGVLQVLLLEVVLSEATAGLSARMSCRAVPTTASAASMFSRRDHSVYGMALCMAVSMCAMAGIQSAVCR